MTDSPGDTAGSISVLRIVWIDPPAERCTFPLGHPYIELVYTPLIGASAVLFLRRIAPLTQYRDEIELDAVAIARELGLRSNDDRLLGRNSPLVKALHRLERVGAARPPGDRRFGVYRQAPALAEEQVRKLPDSLRSVHRHYVRQTAAQ